MSAWWAALEEGMVCPAIHGSSGYDSFLLRPTAPLNSKNGGSET